MEFNNFSIKSYVDYLSTVKAKYVAFPSENSIEISNEDLLLFITQYMKYCTYSIGIVYVILSINIIILLVSFYILLKLRKIKKHNDSLTQTDNSDSFKGDPIENEVDIDDVQKINFYKNLVLNHLLIDEDFRRFVKGLKEPVLIFEKLCSIEKNILSGNVQRKKEIFEITEKLVIKVLEQEKNKIEDITKPSLVKIDATYQLLNAFSMRIDSILGDKFSIKKIDIDQNSKECTIVISCSTSLLSTQPFLFSENSNIVNTKNKIIKK